MRLSGTDSPSGVEVADGEGELLLVAVEPGQGSVELAREPGELLLGEMLSGTRVIPLG